MTIIWVYVEIRLFRIIAAVLACILWLLVILLWFYLYWLFRLLIWGRYTNRSDLFYTILGFLHSLFHFLFSCDKWLHSILEAKWLLFIWCPLIRHQIEEIRQVGLDLLKTVVSSFHWTPRIHARNLFYRSASQ